MVYTMVQILLMCVYLYFYNIISNRAERTSFCLARKLHRIYKERKVIIKKERKKNTNGRKKKNKKKKRCADTFKRDQDRNLILLK